MQGRIAFTAGLWGDAAVVCRAVEGQPGPVVDPQFGVFDTWTHANDFAANLNHGLDVDPLEARQIVTSAILARAHLLQATGCLDIVCTDAPVLIVANALQVRLLLTHLALALTFCRLARTLETESGGDRLLRNARSALLLAVTSMFRLQIEDDEFEEIQARLELLKLALREFSPQNALVRLDSVSS